MRIRLSDLAPGINYAIQLRSNTGDAVSDWSRAFFLLTSNDTTAPNTPGSVAGSMNGTTFNLSWSAVTLSSDGTAAYDLDHYEVKVESAGTGTTGVYLVNDTKFQFTLDLNRQLFTAPRANIKMSVRAVDKVGNTSAYSSIVDQTNAAPATPANFTATPLQDAISLKWDAVADTDLLHYRVYSGTVAGTQTTLVWQGGATGATIPSTLYSSDRWYKVVAVDVFTTESATGAVAGPVRPNSPFAVDSTAPAVPTGLAATLTTQNTASEVLVSAAVSWTAVTDTDGDLAGYQIGYRSVGSSDWQYTTADYTVTSTKIDRLTAYVNYEFRIRSFDFLANYSAWSSTVTTTTAGSNSAPAQTTGLIGVAGASTVTVLWTEATESDVKNGAGMYEVQMDTVNTFNSANLQTIKTAATVASFRTDGLAAGNRYVRVRAVDSLGLTGSYSTTLTLNQTDIGATEAYTQSRGMNLVTNATGGLGNNKNFTSFTFDASDRPFGGGSFKTSVVAGPQSAFSDELMPVDTAKTYIQTGYVRQCIVGQLGARFYLGIAAFDVDGLAIGAINHMYIANTLTTLAAPLNPGDTTVTLTSAANWYNSTSTANKGIIFWTYTDSKGYTYPENTYSRNLSVSQDMWNSGGISGNVITLKVPWAGPAYASGTKVSNGAAGGSYKYISASNQIAPQTWTKFTGRIGGVDYSGQNVTNMFPPGTAYAKFLFLSHYPTLTPGFNSQLAYAGLNFTDVDGANLLPSTMGGDVVIANTLAGDRVIANSLDANTLKANTAFLQDLSVKSKFTLGDASTDGIIESYDYGTSSGATGFRLAKSGLIIKTGQIEAAALKIQTGNNMMPAAYADFEYGNDYYINAFWTPRGQGNLAMVTGGLANSNLQNDAFTKPFKGSRYLGVSTLGSNQALHFQLTSSTDNYNIDVEASTSYIFSAYFRNNSTTAATYTFYCKGDNGSTLASVSVPLAAGRTGIWQRAEATVTIPASGVTKVLLGVQDTTATIPHDCHIDAVQFEPKGNLTVASTWNPPRVTTIDMSGITTGMLRSSNNITVGGTDQPLWSLNTQGNLQIGDALVRGKLIVGSASDLVSDRIVNGNYETNITGSTAYQEGVGTLTTATASRTTTVGEVINGTGSFKVATTVPTLPNGRRQLGAQVMLDSPIVGPADITVSYSIQSDEPTASNANYWGNMVYLGNSGNFNVVSDSVGVGDNQTVNTPKDYSVVLSIGNGVTVDRVTIAKATLLTTTTDYLAATKVMIDNVNVASNLDNVGSYSASYNFVSGDGGVGWRIDGAGNAEFNTGVFRGRLGAGIVNADTLSSTITISSNFRTADTGKRVEFNSDGIIVYKADGTPTVVLPTDTETNSSFDGDMLAQSLTVSDQLAIRGTNNELSKGATLTLASGTTSPTSPPTVTVGWKTIPCTTGSATFDPYRYGVSVQGGWFRVPSVIYGAGTIVESYHLTTGVRQYGSLNIYANDGMWNALGGSTSIGNNFYALGQRKDGSWRLMGWTFGTGVSGTPTRFLNVAYTQGPNDRLPALGNDGTNLLIALTNTTDNIVRYKTANATTGALSTSVVSNLTYGADMAFINKGVFDSGFGAATVYVVGARTGQTAWVFNSSFQRLGQYDFSTNGKPMGQCYYNGKFYTFDASGGKITEHTNISWNSSTTTSTWWAGNTWYNTDATNGNKQTTVGPLKSFTMKQRAMVTITSPPIPLRPVPNTVDDATAAGVYIARNSATPSRTMLERYAYLADGVRVTTIEANPSPFPTPGGAATNPPPATTDIPASSPSVLRSANDRFVLNGDGSGDWADLDVSAAGVLTIPGRLPKAIATGTVSIAAVANGASTGATVVNFPAGRFASAPRVVLTPGSGRLTVAISATSTTSFTFNADNWSGANASANTGYWIAILE